MKSQSNNRLWVLVTVVLLLANIGLLAYIVWGKQPGKKQGQERGRFMGNYLKNELGFSKEQMATFESMRNTHRENSKPIFEDMRAIKAKNLRDLGQAGFSDSAIITAAKNMGQQQEQLEIQMLKNLRSIRDICTPEQKQKFDTGFYKMMARERKKKKKKDDK